MIKLIVIFLLFYCVINIYKRPIIPILGYYLNAILSPKHLWFWAFEGIPASFILTLSVLASCAIVIVRDPTRLRTLREPQNICLICLLGLIYLADYFASYPKVNGPLTAELVLTTLSTLIVVYFASLFCLKTEKDLHLLAFGIIVPTLYYTYWGNMAYITGDIWLRASTGRLVGPSGSNYVDENSFSMLFVVGMPFVFFWALSQKNAKLKWLFMCSLPAIWHVIFLCGSRGAMLGTAAATLACLYFARSKKLSILVISLLTLALLTQGGILLTRTEETVQNQDSSSEEAINPRIYSWEAGIHMIKDYPLLGIGTERFLAAYRDYQIGKLHVAHNTFIQIAANNGLPAGIIYLYVFYAAWRYHRKTNKDRIAEISNGSQFGYLENAIWCSMIGFFVCSIFLDLLISELLYFLLLMHLARKLIRQKETYSLPEQVEQTK